MTTKQAECIIFPDIHGRGFWKRVLDGSCGWDAPKYIYLGDYFDPYPSEGITPGDAIRNWYEMNLALKGHEDKEFIFLMGNHDAHYVSTYFSNYARGSRYSRRYCGKIKELLTRVKLQIALEMNVNGQKIMFTHAGVTAPWHNTYRDFIGELSADNLNKLTESDQGWLALSDVSFYRSGGQPYGSPLWADSEEYTEGNLKGIDYDWQIVGHNQLKDDNEAIFGNVIDLDCHHAFALTSELDLVKL